MTDKLTETVQAELRRFGPNDDLGSLLDRWPGAVGNAIARNAWPSRIARDGTLHVNTADAVWAFELAQRAVEIARRLGVPSIRFAPGPLPVSSELPAPRFAPRPTAAQRRAAAAIASPIRVPELREAVAQAVSLSLARGSSDRAV